MTKKELKSLEVLNRELELLRQDVITPMQNQICNFDEKLDKIIAKHEEDRSKFVTKKAMQWIVGTAITLTSVAVSIINSIKAQ